MSLGPVFVFLQHVVFSFLFLQVLSDIELMLAIVSRTVNHHHIEYSHSNSASSRPALDLHLFNPLHHLQHGVSFHFIYFSLIANAANMVL